MSSQAAGNTGEQVLRLPGMIGEELARTLSEQIITLRLRPGMHLTEDEVCGQYVVSRSPVREAFRILEADGLVLRLVRRGVRVTPMSPQDLQEVYACRTVLEGLAAREAARNATADDLANMRRLLSDMERSLRGKKVQAFFNSNVAFTKAVHHAANNQTLLRIAAGIEKQALRYRYLAHSHTQEILDLSFAGHSEVFDAIVRRKPVQAERSGQTLMRKAEAVILSVLKEVWPTGLGATP